MAGGLICIWKENVFEMEESFLRECPTNKQ